MGKEFFRTCNVLPFSCTHLALGFKNFFTVGGIKTEILNGKIQMEVAVPQRWLFTVHPSRLFGKVENI